MPVVPLDSPPDGGGGGGSKLPWIIGAVIAVLVGGGLLAFFLTQGDDDPDEVADVTVPDEVTVPNPDDVTVPDITIPSITVPDITIPDITFPDITVPDITIPDITIPDFTIPDLSLPDFSIPDVITGPIPEPTEEPTGLGDDATFNGLAQDCYDGDMQSCDDLYDESPASSDYEAYGDTCAGRQPRGTFVYCRVRFPGE